MIQKFAPLVTVSSPEEVHQHFADDLCDQISRANSAERPLRIILPIGPVAQYSIITARCNREKISWRNVYLTLMDEYLDWQGRPLAAGHPLSFQGQFLEFIGELEPSLRPLDQNWILPDPFEIGRVDVFIEKIGGIDICYGGIGVHGHIAFNEPPISRYGEISIGEFQNSETRVITLAPETFVINALRAAGGRFSDFPTMAVTIGMKHILAAKRIRLYVDGGTRQQEAVYQYVKGDVSVRYPVTLLRNHEDVQVIADALTAEKAVCE